MEGPRKPRICSILVADYKAGDSSIVGYCVGGTVILFVPVLR